MEIMQYICAENMNIDALITDPPYGKNYTHGGSYNPLKGASTRFVGKKIIGDDKPFDPTPFLKFKTIILFGANYYADKLPISGGWVVWDKLNGLKSKRTWGFNDNSDCELIWTNIGNTARIVRHCWMGIIRESENAEKHVHPTQKPIALMVKLIKHYTKVGDTILDPYMGSGTTGIACVKTGRNFIGIEIEEEYFDVAQKRIEEAIDDI